MSNDEKVMVSLNELNQAVRDAAPKIKASVEAKPKKALDATTFELMSAKVEEKGLAVEAAAPIDDAMNTFCGLCVKVRPIINIGMTFADWVLTKSQVAMAKLWINIVYTKFVDKVCAK